MAILQDQERQIFSSGILRLVGYGLLTMAIIDLLFLLIPPQLMNPLWEFQTMGAIVERIPVTLLGIVLVYYGEKSDRAPIEALILKSLSWISLIVAILLLLMIPLNISNSFRIYHQQTATTNTQLISQKDAIQQLKEQLKTANSKNEIGAILEQQAQQQVNIPDAVNTQKLKTDILTNLQHNQDNLTTQAQAFKAQKRSVLLKNCLKWNLGGLIAAILFFLIWKTTNWARVNVDLNED